MFWELATRWCIKVELHAGCIYAFILWTKYWTFRRFRSLVKKERRRSVQRKGFVVWCRGLFFRILLQGNALKCNVCPTWINATSSALSLTEEHRPSAREFCVSPAHINHSRIHIQHITTLLHLMWVRVSTPITRCHLATSRSCSGLARGTLSGCWPHFATKCFRAARAGPCWSVCVGWRLTCMHSRFPFRARPICAFLNSKNKNVIGIS